MQLAIFAQFCHTIQPLAFRVTQDNYYLTCVATMSLMQAVSLESECDRMVYAKECQIIKRSIEALGRRTRLLGTDKIKINPRIDFQERLKQYSTG